VIHFFLPQVTRPALERNEDKRAEYQIKVATAYLPEQLVFLDESACNRNATKRDYAWAPINGRARRHDYFVRGKRCVFFILTLGSNSTKWPVTQSSPRYPLRVSSISMFKTPRILLKPSIHSLMPFSIT
jgi:hypothetical protein